MIKQLWQKAARHRGRENMAGGVDLTVAQKHNKRFIKQGSTEMLEPFITICPGV